MSHSPLSSSVLSFELSQFVATKLGLVFLSMMMIVVVAQGAGTRRALTIRVRNDDRTSRSHATPSPFIESSFAELLPANKAKRIHRVRFHLFVLVLDGASSPKVTLCIVRAMRGYWCKMLEHAS
jgi:hypothetical protein